jgi:hypothetical protein
LSGLANTLIPLVVGFALTTVLGGFLGSWLQRRAWDHQKDVQLREDEFRRADNVCNQLSKLMDKRLYRMLRFYDALASNVGTSDGSTRVQDSLKEYDAILYEWNDNLNLNLALVGTYFGKAARDWLDSQIYEDYKQVGAELENYYYGSMRGARTELGLNEIKAHLDALSSQVYRLGVFMMTQLREGLVGRTAPDPLQVSRSPEQVRVPTTVRRV